MMDRRLVENFDWWIIWTLLSILSIGLLSLYSALYPQIQANPTHNLFIKQIVWISLGLTVLFGTLLIDYDRLKSLSIWIYLLALLLLVAVLLVGKEVNGSKRWLDFGGFQLQPSEFMKGVIVIQLASYFSSQDIAPFPSFGKLIIPALLTGAPIVLILLEPDLGTAICVITISATLIFFMGIRWRYILISALGFVPLIWPIWHHVLKPYQKTRILILLRPDLDPLGAGYHIRQSKIAIGSGMTWGKGFLNGTQNKLHFLPEKHTDFIFSVWAEEWGFAGCFVLLLLFALLVFLALRVARRSKDRFGSLLVVGMTALIMWQVLINIGMVIGVLPVVGIPLPFVSYGGSSLVTLCFAIGIIENVSMRRYVFQSQ
ncbi:rod shape-determining protein RodA [Desulfoferrobacter suflitae]|uniref:rod shape-determining protein RodA n=1 Tax=Desulfoferrobacter suflitae TaxID=2865782 RepID=UPI002164BA56|nr:rod shape-determining protein RodA [Desulfoferrobacter suflitae]MCK8601132.1 rod shape-determining protein RodA [Desulfoferrobacter suflitae]